MIQDVETDALKPLDFNHLKSHVPEVNRLNVNLESVAFEKPIDSSNIQIDVIQRLGEIIADNYEQKDGFVILHGTDTMSYTASALSFMLEGLKKPVILTGSQLPIGVTRTDGKENLITAIEIAAAQKSVGKQIHEVCIYFENQLMRGNRTHKYSAEHFDAFKSPNYPVLAKAGVHINYDLAAINVSKSRSFMLRTSLNNNIAVLSLFPGISAFALKGFENMEGLKGLIIHSFGSGNIPDSKHISKTLNVLLAKGVIIYNVTQCNSGFVDRRAYATNKDLLKSDIVDGADITLEAAIMKMMYVLGLNLSLKESQYHLAQNLRGEISNDN